MTRDFYADSYEVAERLAQANEMRWEHKITSAIEEGSTSTEILMALRFYLIELLKSPVILDTSTTTLVHGLAVDLSHTLDMEMPTFQDPAKP